MEDNKLIAEFMGFQHTDLGWYDAEENLINVEKDNTFDELKFHNDWNWLMHVVDKIEGLNFSVEMNRQEEGDYQCLIVKKEIIVQTFSSNKMKSVYQAVVKFIKWYEQNNN